MDKFVNKDGKEVLKITDDNQLFIDKELKDKKKVVKDGANESKVLSEDGKDSADSE